MFDAKRAGYIWTFTGKGGREIQCDIWSPALARIIDELSHLAGQRLFQYHDESGRRRRISAADANAYLQEIAKAPISAKDFRTLAATAAAAKKLAPVEPAASRTGIRRQVATVVKEIAEFLGNTPAVARKSYVHRRLVDAFSDGKLKRTIRCRVSGLSRGEATVAMLFK